MQDSWIYKIEKEIEFLYYQNMKPPSALRGYIHLIGKTVPKSAYRKKSADVPFIILQQNTATLLGKKILQSYSQLLLQTGCAFSCSI